MARAVLLLLPLLLMALLATPRGAGASQTDLAIFSAGGTGAPPNVMLLLDTSKSMQSGSAGCGSCTKAKWEMARDALRDIILAVNPLDGGGNHIENARFGLAQFDRANFGGLLLIPIADGNTASIITRLGLYTSSDQAGGTPTGPALTDVMRYYAGAEGWGSLPLHGTMPVRKPVTSWPPPVGQAELTAPSPIDLDCRENMVVVLSDGEADTSDNGKYVGFSNDGTQWCFPPGNCPMSPPLMDATNFCNTIGDADGDLVEQPCPATCGADGANKPMMGENCPAAWNYTDWIDDVAYAAFRHDFSFAIPGQQNIITHAIAYDFSGAGRDALIDTAMHGGGTFHDANDYQSIYDALIAITTIAFDSQVSFAAPTVPSSRLADEGLFFYSYFQPKTDQAHWAGGLAAFGVSASGQLVDSGGIPLVSGGNGAIDPNAPSFWDAGDQLKTNTTRTLYSTDTAGNRIGFDGVNIPPMLTLTVDDPPLYPNYPASGITTLPEIRDAVIDYVYGMDAFDEDGDLNFTELRPSVLGDIFHSGPVLVGKPPGRLYEYGYTIGSDTFMDRYGARDRVIYAGANDGMLHAFDAGNAADLIAPEGTGDELFGYVPGVLLPTLKEMPINIPRTTYYVDGSPVVADVWLGATHDYLSPKVADQWATLLMVGMREGGEGYLALDVTDPLAVTRPYPDLLWEFTDPKLAQAWSEPVLTRVKIRGGTGLGDRCGANDGDGDCREQWVAIFGGGYQEDGNPNSLAYISDPASASWSDKGKAIFMVSLDDGSVLATAAFDASDVSADGLGQMKFAIPSAPAVLDIDFDGFADRVYIGDLGGQVWKWDISSVGVDTDADPEIDNWTANVFARAYSLAAWSGGPGHYHSIFAPPSAAFNKGKLVLAFGTGEREDLLYAGVPGDSENNRFYVMADDPTVATPLYEDNLTDVTNPLVSPDPTKSGFYMIAVDGEKFLTEHIIFGGKVITTSFSPNEVVVSADPCASSSGGGSSFIYIFDLTTGAGFFVDATAPTGLSRRLVAGSGLSTGPKLSVGPNDANFLYVKTSGGVVLETPAPPSTGTPVDMVYWRTKF